MIYSTNPPATPTAANAGPPPLYRGNIFILVLLCFGLLYNVGNRPRFTDATPFYFYKLNDFYSPSEIERYGLEHAIELEYHLPLPKGCTMWTDKSRTIYEALEVYLEEAEDYQRLLVQASSPVPNVQHYLFPPASISTANNSVSSTVMSTATQISRNTKGLCEALEVHPHGLGGVFRSGSLSRTSQGLVEPLFAPFHDPSTCLEGTTVMRLLRSATGSKAATAATHNHLVHDFSAYCRQLQPTSRLILVDIGATYKPMPTSKEKNTEEGANYIVQLYERFGFPFDDVYSIQVGNGDRVGAITSYLTTITNGRPAYHSFSMPSDDLYIDTNDADGNPDWQALWKNMRDEDLVVIVVDPRVHPFDATPLAQQWQKENSLANLIDALYWYPDVAMVGDSSSKSGSDTAKMTNTVHEALQLMSALRYKGIPVHAWV